MTRKIFVIAVLLGVMVMAAQVSARDLNGIGWSTRSWYAIEQLTHREVTSKYLWEFNEKEPYLTDVAGRKIFVVETNGAVELSDDGVKRRFWCHFNSNTGDLLRLKIDGDLLYTALGW